MADNKHTKRPPVVPKRYAGQWVAWDHELTRIIASGRSAAEVKQAAESAGESKPVLAKVPRANVRFIGGAR